MVLVERLSSTSTLGSGGSFTKWVLQLVFVHFSNRFLSSRYVYLCPLYSIMSGSPSKENTVLMSPVEEISLIYLDSFYNVVLIY